MNAGRVGAAGSFRKLARAAVPLALCLLAFDAIAQAEEPRGGFGSQALARAASDDKPHAQLELSGSSLPRFDNIDGASRSSRMDLSLLPAGRSSIGPAVGVTSLDPQGLGNPGFSNTAPAVDLGVHWRYMTDSNSRVDVRAWRRMPQPDAVTLAQSRDTSYGARVDMQLSQVPKSGFIADHGVGLQLESGARLMVRRSGGKPMVYYRAGF